MSMDVNSETARKLREMGAAELLDALKAQDDGTCMGLTCAERPRPCRPPGGACDVSLIRGS